MDKVFWYSITERALVNLEPTEEELKNIKDAMGSCPSLAITVRAAALKLIPVVPVWTYGTLMSGESKHQLIKSIALPEFKPVSAMVEGIQIYSNPNVLYPAAVLSPDSKTYMERYLVQVRDLHILDQYEGAPDLYDLAPLPNGEGWFYEWKLGLESWEPVKSGSWKNQVMG